VLLVVADDLIWASRLASAAERTGLSVRRASSLPAEQGVVSSAIVDLGGRRYDGIEAIARLSEAGAAVAAVCNHEDVALRRRALDAGAHQVWSYNRFHREGPVLVERWLRPVVAS
jgi:DNA-binding response OmpR family regulator